MTKKEAVMVDPLGLRRNGGGQPGAQTLAERPVGDLLKGFSDQARRLAAQEMDLAKTEMAEKAKEAGVAGGMFASAGLFGLLGLLTLTAAMVLALSTAVTPWLAALIVTGFYLVLAGVMAVIGKARLAKATPLAPTQAIKSVKEDIAWLKTRAKSART
jgi:hypothetical protein